MPARVEGPARPVVDASRRALPPVARARVRVSEHMFDVLPWEPPTSSRAASSSTPEPGAPPSGSARAAPRGSCPARSVLARRTRAGVKQLGLESAITRARTHPILTQPGAPALRLGVGGEPSKVRLRYGTSHGSTGPNALDTCSRAARHSRTQHHEAARMACGVRNTAGTVDACGPSLPSSPSIAGSRCPANDAPERFESPRLG